MGYMNNNDYITVAAEKDSMNKPYRFKMLTDDMAIRCKCVADVTFRHVENGITYGGADVVDILNICNRFLTDQDNPNAEAIYAINRAITILQIEQPLNDHNMTKDLIEKYDKKKPVIGLTVSAALKKTYYNFYYLINKFHKYGYNTITNQISYDRLFDFFEFDFYDREDISRIISGKDIIFIEKNSKAVFIPNDLDKFMSTKEYNTEFNHNFVLPIGEKQFFEFDKNTIVIELSGDAFYYVEAFAIAILDDYFCTIDNYNMANKFLFTNYTEE